MFTIALWEFYVRFEDTEVEEEVTGHADGGWCDRANGGVEVEMFLDEATFAAAIGQQPKWLIRGGVPQQFSSLEGLSPNLFPSSKGVPFNYTSLGWDIAKEHYDRAHTGGWVTGPPTHLVEVRMKSEWALTHFMNKELIADPWYEGVYFKKPVNVENYPGIQMTVTPIQGSDIPVR